MSLITDFQKRCGSGAHNQLILLQGCCDSPPFQKDLVLEKSYCDENGLMFGSTRLLILPKILKVESIAKHDKLVAYEAKVLRKPRIRGPGGSEFSIFFGEVERGIASDRDKEFRSR